MKSSKVRVLDKNDHILIKALSDLGMSRNAATTMAYLMNVDEASSQEIEISTGLRQPEVSLAIGLMCNHSWVNVRLEKKTGKGRPTKIYSLASPVDEIISYYEDQIFKESQATLSAIKKLKVMSKQVSVTPQSEGFQTGFAP